MKILKHNSILPVFLAVFFRVATPTAAAPIAPDYRIQVLATFLEHYKCPTPYYIPEYLKAADKYGIDYRFLPAISLQESTCGKHQRLNNLWGYNSAKTGFKSVEEGIDFVSNKLANGKYYAGKDLKGKLRAYNPNPAYAGKIIKIMDSIK